MFADSRRQPRFEVFDPYLAFAARYEVTVDGMEHNDFVSQGASQRTIPCTATTRPSVPRSCDFWTRI